LSKEQTGQERVGGLRGKRLEIDAKKRRYRSHKRTRENSHKDRKKETSKKEEKKKGRGRCKKEEGRVGDHD
jgi:hypothetical protein